MYPIKYVRESVRKVNFIYDDKDWREWNERGRKYGDVGPALISHEILASGATMVHYLCYGTIDHPMNERIKLSLIHNEAFDGKLQTPEWYLKYNAEKREAEFWKDLTKTMRIVFIPNDPPPTHNIKIVKHDTGKSNS